MRVVVPLPLCNSAPVPLITWLIDRPVSVRLNTKLPLSVMGPATAPVVPPAPRLSVLPLLIVVAPVKPEFAFDTAVVPVPAMARPAEPEMAPEYVTPPELELLSVAPLDPTVTASERVKPDVPVVAKVPPLIVSPPAPVPSGAALDTATVLPLPIVVAPVKLLPLAPDSVVVPVPVKLSAVDPVTTPERVTPPLSVLLTVPPPVPKVIALLRLIEELPVVASVPPARVSPPLDMFEAEEIDNAAPEFTVVV